VFIKIIGVFGAQTHLPAVCDQVVASVPSITISRRGKPLVVISPVSPEKGDR
jgi:antitoxin (DNA-binding transcriptional repressor) of toxin-antitoxin stability system